MKVVWYTFLQHSVGEMFNSVCFSDSPSITRDVLGYHSY